MAEQTWGELVREVRGMADSNRGASGAVDEYGRRITGGYGVSDDKTSDPWARRSEGMTCRTCMWYCPKTVLGLPKGVGRCRRHAPTMQGYPVVYDRDWCGDHKLNENA